jgi:putative heme-binding domain-containing protein
VLDDCAGTPQFVQLVAKFNLADRYPAVLALAQEHSQEQIAIEAIEVLLDKNQEDALRRALHGDDPAVVQATMAALSTSSDNRAAPVLLEIVGDGEAPIEARRAAVRALGGIRNGAVKLQEMAQAASYDPALKEALAATLHTVQWGDIKERGLELFPLPPGKDSEPIPPIEVLAQRTGDVTNGRIVFHSTGTCAKCHVVNTIGLNVGPDLSEIGKKLTKPALLESILFPSAAISHNYETWTVLDADGNVVTGLLVSETPEEIQIKDEKGLVRTVKVADIEEKKKQDVSLMPADLQKVLSVKDLVDVVEYMTTLRQAQQAAGGE